MANTANQAFCPPRELVFKHLPAQPWDPPADHKLLTLQFSLSPDKRYPLILINKNKWFPQRGSALN